MLLPSHFNVSYTTAIPCVCRWRDFLKQDIAWHLREARRTMLLLEHDLTTARFMLELEMGSKSNVCTSSRIEMRRTRA